MSSAEETAEAMDVYSRLFERAASQMTQELIRSEVEWVRFLADGEQWCRVTENGIEIIPAGCGRHSMTPTMIDGILGENNDNA